MFFDVSVMSAILWGLLLRVLTSTHPYSGEGNAPMFGDFEAQRHWMEITTELPLKEWYVHTEQNDLQYWGLDYPPLTAYHSWLCGKISSYFNPSWTKLNSSRGHESPEHKSFMRYSVLVSEIIIFLPAVLFYASLCLTNTEKDVTVWIFLINPALILIDHGHFQYNSVCLGFFVLFLALVKTERYALAAVAFSLALNFKQIALYFAIPVFLHLLKSCLSPLNVPRFLKISLAVIFTFGVMWGPFLYHGPDNALQVLKRIFPFNRGIYEDKVANFWYVGSLLIKFKNIFSPEHLKQMALASTVLAALPSWVMLLCQGKDRHRNLMNFKLALFNTSMAFYLFSYMVHEKSILFPLTALLLVSANYPELVFYFTGVACFSLVPLLSKDGLLLAYAPLLCQSCLIMYKSHFEGLPERRWNKYYFLRMLMFISLTLAIALHICDAFVDPPKRYPHLYVALNCAFCFVHFGLFYLYGHIVQWRYTGNIQVKKDD